MVLEPLNSYADDVVDYSRLYSFTPLTPPERRTSREVKDVKDNASVAGSDALSDFDPSELTFTQSQHNLNLNNLNASTSSTSSMLSTGALTTSTPPNGSILGASVQRRDSTARVQRRDSTNTGVHTLRHRDSSPQLNSQLTSPSTGTMVGPINNGSTILAAGFVLNQSVNMGTRPGLHLRSFSSPDGEGGVGTSSPVGPGAVDDSVPKSNAKSVYKLCHRGSCHLLNF